MSGSLHQAPGFLAPCHSSRSGARSAPHCSPSPAAQIAGGTSTHCSSYPASPASAHSGAPTQLNLGSLIFHDSATINAKLASLQAQLAEGTTGADFEGQLKSAGYLKQRTLKSRASLHRPFQSLSKSFSLKGSKDIKGDTSVNTNISHLLSTDLLYCQSDLTKLQDRINREEIVQQQIPLGRTSPTQFFRQATGMNLNMDLLKTSPSSKDYADLNQENSPSQQGETGTDINGNNSNQEWRGQCQSSPQDQRAATSSPAPLTVPFPFKLSVPSPNTLQQTQHTIVNDGKTAPNNLILGCSTTRPGSQPHIEISSSSGVGSPGDNIQAPISSGSTRPTPGNLNRLNDNSIMSTAGSSTVSERPFIQSYASLTPWTTKLITNNYTPLPAPTAETLPLSLGLTDNRILSPCAKHNQPDYSATQYVPGLVSFKRHRSQGTFGEETASEEMTNPAEDIRRPATASPSPYSNTESHPLKKDSYKMPLNKERRFMRTADALRKAGLWDVAMRTGNLVRRNQELQRELDKFRTDALNFLKSVIKNPHNRHIIKNVLSNALASSGRLDHAGMRSKLGVKKNSSVMNIVVTTALAAAQHTTSTQQTLDSAGSSDGTSSNEGGSLSGNASDSSDSQSGNNYADISDGESVFPSFKFGSCGSVAAMDVG